MEDQPTPAAFWPADVLGRPVYDLAGRTVGRVDRCEPPEGPVEKVDVTLTRRSARRLRQGHLLVSWKDIIAAGDAVTLREEANYVAHPEQAPRES